MSYLFTASSITYRRLSLFMGGHRAAALSLRLCANVIAGEPRIAHLKTNGRQQFRFLSPYRSDRRRRACEGRDRSIRYAGWRVIGCTDNDPAPRSIVGAPVLGYRRLAVQSCTRPAFTPRLLPLEITNYAKSKSVRLLELGFDLPDVIGPNTAVSPSAAIRRGVAISAAL